MANRQTKYYPSEMIEIHWSMVIYIQWTNFCQTIRCVWKICQTNRSRRNLLHFWCLARPLNCKNIQYEFMLFAWMARIKSSLAAVYQLQPIPIEWNGRASQWIGGSGCIKWNFIDWFLSVFIGAMCICAGNACIWSNGRLCVIQFMQQTRERARDCTCVCVAIRQRSNGHRCPNQNRYHWYDACALL